ncbi:50S ribosomal protein L13 [Candidatus Pacearchaeota archaeon]|nr:50S ribosomal protein L13 [Candidatus Pacearchaeota archaeon]
MIEVIDGKGAVLGRLASCVAKELLRGKEIAVVNSEEVIITGNKKGIREDFLAKRTKVGSGQQGPKYSRDPEQIVKRAIRGMLPRARVKGRGRDALKRVKCYKGVPKEFENAKKKTLEEEKFKFMKVGEIYS